ncbi:hypothetical protein B0H14DRAFT_3873752 [Mycena olivaceomarginata]|nr:hypothetical protein B0H14DRAFT_3873752 [Mycena olivaceomarginata]
MWPSGSDCRSDRCGYSFLAKSYVWPNLSCVASVRFDAEVKYGLHTVSTPIFESLVEQDILLTNYNASLPALGTSCHSGRCHSRRLRFQVPYCPADAQRSLAIRGSVGHRDIAFFERQPVRMTVTSAGASRRAWARRWRCWIAGIGWSWTSPRKLGVWISRARCIAIFLSLSPPPRQALRHQLFLSTFVPLLEPPPREYHPPRRLQGSRTRWIPGWLLGVSCVGIPNPTYLGWWCFARPDACSLSLFDPHLVPTRAIQGQASVLSCAHFRPPFHTKLFPPSLALPALILLSHPALFFLFLYTFISWLPVIVRVLRPPSSRSHPLCFDPYSHRTLL